MIRLCISTQTPPIRPLAAPPKRAGALWQLGRDYVPQVGGVVPMMRALLREGRSAWIAPNPRWVAMGASGVPGEIRTSEGYTVETLDILPEQKELYGRFKESVWRSFHGPGFPEFVPEEYRAFVAYSYATADRLLRHLGQYDLFYINDFQQILCGVLIGSAAPALLRWHIPIEFRGYPEPVRRFFLKMMEGYDAIVVSTRSGLEELIRAGFHGRAYQIYPYVDPREHVAPPPSAMEAFRDKFGLGSAPVALSVSRLDPVKRQDLLIDAFVSVHRRFPDVKLVLVGGGSFSTRNLVGTRARSKAEVWEDELRALIRRRGLEDHVVMTGGVTSEELAAAYASASLFVHPAPWEGFGLVVIEAWLHGVPVVVSRGAGVAELVDDGINGYSVASGSVAGLSARIEQLLAHPSDAERMGAIGTLSARRCTVRRAASRLREIFERTIQQYERSGLVPRRLEGLPHP